jgi:NADPH2 dehydrogenase
VIAISEQLPLLHPSWKVQHISVNMATSEKLFQPIKLGTRTLTNRIVMAPLTRFRADAQHNPSPLAAEYYAQRSCVPGTLLVTEAIFISPSAGGYKSIPGIWTPTQVAGWKKIVDAVHAKGGVIFAQLWSLGRVATQAVLTEEGAGEVHSASAIPVDAAQTNVGKGLSVPKAMTVEEVQKRVEEYATAAKNALEAGFDGVEIHGQLSNPPSCSLTCSPRPLLQEPTATS